MEATSYTVTLLDADRADFDYDQDNGVVCVYLEEHTFLCLLDDIAADKAYVYYIGSRFNKFNDYLARPSKWKADFSSVDVPDQCDSKNVIVFCYEYQIAKHPEMSLIGKYKNKRKNPCCNKSGKRYKYPVIYTKVYSQSAAKIRELYDNYFQYLATRKSQSLDYNPSEGERVTIDLKK